MQESRESARRELAALQEQERCLAKALLQEEERMQALREEETALAAQTAELQDQQVCALKLVLMVASCLIWTTW